MAPYYACLACVTLAAYLAEKAGSVRGVSWSCIVVAFASMVLLAGLRDSCVGTDTGKYIRRYEREPAVSDIWEGSYEPGYTALSAAGHSISPNYWMLLTAIAVVVVACHMIAIYQCSLNPAISLFVLIASGYYTLFFNGARQGLACAVYSLGFRSLLHGNFRRYALYVALALFFHKSAIIALPLYFAFRQRTSLKYLALAGLAAALAVPLFPRVLQFASIASERYFVYQTLEARGGALFALWFFLLTAFFLLVRPSVSDADRLAYDCFLNMLIVGAIICIVVRLSGAYVELTRLAFYFTIAPVFLWPIGLRSIPNPIVRVVGGLGAAVGHLVFFWMFLSKFSNLAPYRINEEVARFVSRVV